MSTQVTPATQLATVGVDEIAGPVGDAKTPRPRSLAARRPPRGRLATLLY